MHSGYHPLKILLGWCTVDIILLRILLVWCTLDIILLSLGGGYHPLLRILLVWCTVDIILLSIVPKGYCLGGAVDIMDTACVVHSGYHPIKDTCVVHSGYHPLKDIACVVLIRLRILLVWCTVDIILLSIVLLGYC